MKESITTANKFPEMLSTQLGVMQNVVMQEHGRLMRLLMRLEQENDTLQVANNHLREQLGLPVAKDTGMQMKAVEAVEHGDADQAMQYISVVPCSSPTPQPPPALTNGPAPPVARPAFVYTNEADADEKRLEPNRITVQSPNGGTQSDSNDIVHPWLPSAPDSSADAVEELKLETEDAKDTAVEQDSKKDGKKDSLTVLTLPAPAAEKPRGSILKKDTANSKISAVARASATASGIKLSYENAAPKSVRLSKCDSEGPLNQMADETDSSEEEDVPMISSISAKRKSSDTVPSLRPTMGAGRRITLMLNNNEDAMRGSFMRSSCNTAITVIDQNPERFKAHSCWITSVQSGDAAPTPMLTRDHDDNRCHTQLFDELLTDENLVDESSGSLCKYISKNFVLHPGSAKRLSWDMFGFCLVFYDGVIIPLQFFDPPQMLATTIMAWIARIFWTLDMALAFVTGFQTNDAHIEIRLPKIAKHYLATWFLLDGIIVMIDWMDMATTGQLSAGASRGVAKTMRTMRVLRAVRLLRLVRLLMTAPDVTGKLTMCIRSEEVMIVGGICKIITMVSGIIHIIACCWYAIGKSSWVLAFADEALGYRYACSFHWALTQFIGSADIMPQTHGERAYAVVVLMVAFVTSGVVVSSITTSMTRLQIVTAHYSKQLSMLRRYLIENNISSALAARVQRNAKHIIAEQKKNISESSVELLQYISNPLRVEIHFECYGHVLMWHPFFKAYHQVNGMAFRHLCHVAVSRIKLSKGDVCFSPGETPLNPRMFYITVGKMMYTRPNRRPSHLEAYGWACEVHLWIQGWVHHGQLRALAECDIVCLDAEEFRQTATNFRHKEFYPSKYAQKFAALLNEADTNDISELSSDSVDPKSITKEVFPTRLLGRKTQNSSGTNSGRLTKRQSAFGMMMSMSGGIAGIKKRFSTESWSRASGISDRTSRSSAASASDSTETETWANRSSARRSVSS